MEVLLNTIKEKAAGRAVVLPVFGDAESLATLALCVKALSAENVFCVHIDHGMLRENETAKIKDYINELGILNAEFIKCEHVFLISTAKSHDGKIIGPLSSVCIPSEKREIVLSALDRLYRDAVKSFHRDDLQIFGIQSVGGDSIVEIGDNAMRIALEAGADESLVRQPFPTQALAIRMLCHDSVIALTTEQRESLYSVVEKYSDEFSSRLVPLRSVGICNGERTYKSMAVLSHNGINSDFGKAIEIAEKIDKELPFINRVVCRVDSDAHEYPFHCRPLHLCKKGLDVLRAADAVAADEFKNTTAAQFFAVLLPLVADTSKSYSIVIRAVSTSDFKTAHALVPGIDFSLSVLEKTVERIKKDLGDSVDMVLYDITSKPPAAIEWE